MSTSRPRIAVAWPKPDYLAALERAGADARVLDPQHDTLPAIPAILDDCDGVLLTGGLDVAPARYGQAAHMTVEADSGRDDYEFALTREALDRDLPLLAICRGVQVLNVVAGGSLVQDIPSDLPQALPHQVAEPRDAPAHDVRVGAGTCLARLLSGPSDARYVGVNSRHHQAVGTVAPGFVVSATAPDGVIEAIEKPDASFCVGVQWHPENFWRTGEFRGLFEGLVTAASRRSRG